MQEDEYIEYAECRRTSFTAAKKFAKFRDFCDFSQHMSMKPGNDMLEIFGMYAVEVIKCLTLEALRLKNEMLPYGAPIDVTEQGDEAIRELKANYLFAIEKEEDPLRSYHVREAYRRLKKTESRFESPRKANVLGARFPTSSLLSSSLILDDL